MQQLFKQYLNVDYTYTPFIHEFTKELDVNETLILSNLLNKLYNFNKNLGVNNKNGSEYHFYYNQKDIYTNEICNISRATFQRTLKKLQDKKLINYFIDKKEGNTNYDTTYYFINTKRIRESIIKDNTFIADEKKVPKNGLKSLRGKLNTNINESDRKTCLNRHDKENKLSEDIKMLNQLQFQFNNNEISESEFNSKFQPKKKQIQEKYNIKITKDKIEKVWKIV